MATQPLPQESATRAQPGLEKAVRIARFLSHLFLALGGLSFFICIGARSVFPLLICGGGFLLAYFAWVALVLFGCMNFALSAMLWFVLGLGVCMGLLMSGSGPWMVLGGLGLLVMVFATVIPVSLHDPTTPQAKREKGITTSILFLALPCVCVVLLMIGDACAPAGLVGLVLLTIATMIPHGPHGSKEWHKAEQKGR